MKPKKKKGMSRSVKTLIFIAALVIIILVAIPILVMPQFLGQRYQQEQYDPAEAGIEAQRITLETDDGLALAAWRTRAASPKGSVIIISGIQNPSVTAFFGYARMLAENGWDSLLIEMRARSESEGEEIGLGMTEWLDVKAGVDFLSAEEGTGQRPIVAMGTSMGGGTVIIAAGEIERLDGVIAISAFSSWSDLFVDTMAMLGVPRFIGSLDTPFVNLYLGFHYGFDKLKYSPINGMAKLGKRPILLMHSTGDTQVPYRQYEALLKKANDDGIDVSSFVRDGDQHYICYEEHFMRPEGDPEFSGAVLGFLSRFEQQ